MVTVGSGLDAALAGTSVAEALLTGWEPAVGVLAAFEAASGSTAASTNIDRIGAFASSVSAVLVGMGNVDRVVGVVLDDLTLCMRVSSGTVPDGYLYGGVGSALYDELAAVSGIVPMLVLLDELGAGFNDDARCGFPAANVVFGTPVVQSFSGTCAGLDAGGLGSGPYEQLALVESVVPGPLVPSIAVGFVVVDGEQLTSSSTSSTEASTIIDCAVSSDSTHTLLAEDAPFLAITCGDPQSATDVTTCGTAVSVANENFMSM